MLVEDDDLDVSIMTQAVIDSGIGGPLLVAQGARQALELLHEQARHGAIAPRFVLLDIKMTDMTGHDLLRAIKSDPRLAPLCVVIFTTSNDPSDRRRAYAAGAAGYFVKPLSYEELLIRLQVLERYFDLCEPSEWGHG